ncbi:hypothetical protein MBM_05389 [Drepanopeziza brunnea f. sp. 'multigermtubi' MB_m1]|uniref:Uncharacterized protein n=1 Tax=Marssonina brunnea f. sp. multigermtubi (strain MB_m1) TaxID=1072389 RepID=K1WF68_MARBU|nr:uncharacterized protein MBM_05389 [Drepanopeziza brunnea f. sp. 'multigermtubi' MB_m1]EKD16095.1 hypothetical protein MBM_05389 [Drepanopeziza brunnea f. sp. 'multigermtubi' MB_m1]
MSSVRIIPLPMHYRDGYGTSMIQAKRMRMKAENANLNEFNNDYDYEGLLNLIEYSSESIRIATFLTTLRRLKDLNKVECHAFDSKKNLRIRPLKVLPMLPRFEPFVEPRVLLRLKPREEELPVLPRLEAWRALRRSLFAVRSVSDFEDKDEKDGDFSAIYRNQIGKESQRSSEARSAVAAAASKRNAGTRLKLAKGPLALAAAKEAAAIRARRKEEASPIQKARARRVFMRRFVGGEDAPTRSIIDGFACVAYASKADRQYDNEDEVGDSRASLIRKGDAPLLLPNPARLKEQRLSKSLITKTAKVA